MSNYKNQEFDFVSRTKEIIKQYNTFPIPDKEKYEVTLFLNCLVGLLILPQQHWFNGLPDDIVTHIEWGINETDISIIKNRNKVDEAKSVKNIAKHLRNSIAHYHFEAFANSSKKIDKIEFQDFLPPDKKNKTFEAIIPLTNISQFANKLSETFLTEMSKNKK